MVGIGIVAVLAVIVLAVNFSTPTGLFGLTAAEENSEIRVGWLNTFSESAYIAEPLIRTDILAQNKISAKFTSFLTGPPAAEAAASKNIDVILMGWAPNSFLLEKDPNWVVVGKFAYFEDCLLAKANSGIKTVSDLNGKKFGVPFGSGPYIVVYQELAKNNLVANKDVTLVNIAPNDFAVGLSSNQIDAVGWGKGTMVTLVSKGIANELVCVKDYAIITMSKEFIKQNPKTAKAFMDSVKEASLYFAKNKDSVYSWVAEDSKMDFSLVKQIAYTEPNFDANSISEVKLELSSEDILDLQSRVNFEKAQGILKNGFDFNSKVDLSLLK
jgi:ABC-type nitrate/sulfonate/bicarbonate transport system substrate-binding protein